MGSKSGLFSDPFIHSDISSFWQCNISVHNGVLNYGFSRFILRWMQTNIELTRLFEKHNLENSIQSLTLLEGNQYPQYGVEGGLRFLLAINSLHQKKEKKTCQTYSLIHHRFFFNFISIHLTHKEKFIWFLSI